MASSSTAHHNRSSHLSLRLSLTEACATIGTSVSIARLTAVPMAPDELSTCSRAPDTFSRKITAPSAPRALSSRAAFLISATASLIRLIGRSERHPNAPARNRDRNVQVCAFADAIGYFLPQTCDGVRHRSVQWPVRLPVDQAVRVLSCQALFHHFSDLLFAKLGDEMLPGWCVRHPGNEIIGQDVQLSIRERRFAVIAWVEPGRLRTRLLLFFHVRLQFRSAC